MTEASPSFEDNACELVEAHIIGIGGEHLTAITDKMTTDDVRRLSLSLRTLYLTTRDVWLDRATQDAHDRSTTP